MKPGAKAFGMIGVIICVAGSLVVLWGCGGGGKVAKRADAAAATASAETGADGPAQNEIAAVVETDIGTRKAAGQEEPAGGSFTDPRDNQTYRTVRIGNQTWMAENLNHQTDESWCYGDDQSNCDKYGRLYTWEAAKTACSGLGGGWRLPSDAEWTELVNFVNTSTTSMSNAGSKLKSQTGWTSYSGISSTDDFGFSALPGGSRLSDFDGRFYGVGDRGYWWSATEPAWSRGMIYRYDHEVRVNWDKIDALSVRCVRDVRQ